MDVLGRRWTSTCRNRDGRVVQRQLLYLGERNDGQRAARCRSIEVLQGYSGPAPMALFADDREAPEFDCEVVQIDLSALSLHRPRQWGACWLSMTLWDRLDLDQCCKDRSGPRLSSGGHLRDVHRLLIARDAENPGKTLCPRTDAAGHPG